MTLIINNKPTNSIAVSGIARERVTEAMTSSLEVTGPTLGILVSQAHV